MDERTLLLPHPIIEQAINQATLAEVRSVVACAEGYAILAAASGIARAPGDLVQAAVTATLSGVRPWRAEVVSFAAHLRHAIGLEVGAVMRRRAASAPGAHVGAMAGLLRAARIFADALVPIREHDASIDALSRRVHADVRAQLEAARAATSEGHLAVTPPRPRARRARPPSVATAPSEVAAARPCDMPALAVALVAERASTPTTEPDHPLHPLIPIVIAAIGGLRWQVDAVVGLVLGALQPRAGDGAMRSA